VEYATSPQRGDMKLSKEDLTIRVFNIQRRFWTVFFPLEKTPNVILFWINPGVGISTRLAEEALKHVDEIQEIHVDEALRADLQPTKENPVHEQLRQRILQHLYRTPLDPSRKQASSSDVYLYQTGMAAIYCLHKYLTREFNQQSVLYGFSFHSTYHIFDDFGAGFQFYGLADHNDLETLTSWLQTHYASGNKIQALWCEFPSNPLTTTPDLKALRRLADQYSFFLIVDETIASFCNVDLTSVADVILTSLTKSFSGYADVMGGSIVLNPSLPSYPHLKSIFTTHYRTNDLYSADAETLLANSADYLARMTIHHKNATALTSYLHTCAQDPTSCVKKVYYPTVTPSLPHYKCFMRDATPAFTPGYGCLFSVEFNTIAHASAFYDALDVYKAPHLGAHVTLVLPYVKGLYAKELEWVKQFDMRETQIRVAPGLEGTEDLIGRFERAVEVADMVGTKEGNGVVKGGDVVATIT
jgi:cystathionine gamma-synthase